MSNPSPRPNNALSAAFERFIRLEASGGILLLIALVVALIIANTHFSYLYQAFINLPGIVKIGDLSIEKPLLLWVNDGWMAIFFLLLALEVKREIIDGELSEPEMLILPMIAAVGGILVPALIYVLINWGGDPLTSKGWPIPTTTDVAFVLGIVAVLGKLVPKGLKVFLVTLSIVDDILAIIIIALFYTTKLSMISASLAILGIIALFILNRARVKSLIPYVITGIFIWVCVLKSGIHATLAGVVLGLFIPYEKDKDGISPLKSLERALHPWVAFFILPAFVFVNGGISFHGYTLHSLISAVPLGIAMGLFLGKMVGVFTFAGFVIKMGWARLPAGSNWLQLLATAVLTGVGFTMSLFLSSLAFFGTPYENLARNGIVFGSLISIIVAVTLFKIAYQQNEVLTPSSASN